MQTFSEIYKLYREALHKRIDYVQFLDFEDYNEEECENLRIKEEKLKRLVLGHPDSFDRIRCWMIYVHGVGVHPEGEMGEESTKAIKTEHHAAVDRMGDLAKMTRVIMEEFKLTDSGFGDSSWHLGCHCAEYEAKELSKRLFSQFRDEIDMGIMKVTRIQWSLGLI